jgi:hypothetical protein
MAIGVERSLDFGGVQRIENLPDAQASQEPLTLKQHKDSLHGRIKNIVFLSPGAGAAIGNGTMNFTLSGAGATLSPQTAAANSKQITGLGRLNLSTGGGATNKAGFYVGGRNLYRTNGFYVHSVFGIETHESAMGYFEGIANNAAALTGDPSSALSNYIGIGKDAGDTNWHLLVKDASTGSKIDTGLAVAAGTVLELEILALPDDSKVYLTLLNRTAGTVLYDKEEITANLPASNQLMYFNHQCISSDGTTAKLFSSVSVGIGETLWT